MISDPTTTPTVESFDYQTLLRLFREQGSWGMICYNAIRLNQPGDPVLVFPPAPDIHAILDPPTATLQYSRSITEAQSEKLEDMVSVPDRIAFLRTLPLAPIAAQQFAADVALHRQHLADLRKQDNTCHSLVSARVPKSLWPTIEALEAYTAYLSAPEGMRAVPLFRVVHSAITLASGAGLVRNLTTFFQHKKADTDDLPSFIQQQALLIQSSLQQMADPTQPTHLRLSSITSVAFLAALPPIYNPVVLELLTAHPTGQFLDYHTVTSKVLLYDKSLQSLSSALPPPAAAYAAPAPSAPPVAASAPTGSLPPRPANPKPCKHCFAATGKVYITHSASECRRGKALKHAQATSGKVPGAFAAIGSASEAAALAAWSLTADGQEFQQAMYQAQLDRALNK